MKIYTRNIRSILLACLASVSLIACNKPPTSNKPVGRAATPITTVEVRNSTLRITEKTVGSLESRNDPRIAAEVAGRIERVLVKAGDPVKQGQLLAKINDRDLSNQHKANLAESARLTALLEQQERLLKRQNELVAENFISKNALDDTTAQRNALKSQLDAAQARAAISRINLDKTQVDAPDEGAIDQKFVSPGDYVRIGDPLFHLVSNQGLDIRLQFPETVGAIVRPGQTIEITSPLMPGEKYSATIEEILPRLTETSRSIDVIARLKQGTPLRTGASVDATVVIGETANAILVPEQSIVLRPAGKVVYRIENGKAIQQAVTTGNKEGGWVEITQGLKGGEIVALDGAGFLTDGAAINDKTPAQTTNTQP